MKGRVRWTLGVGTVLLASLSVLIRHRVMTAAMSGRQAPPNAARPEVSPDGKSILAIRADPSSRSMKPFLMNADGSNRRDIALVRDAVWFPDGSRILALKEYGRDDRSIVALMPDGTQERESPLRGAIGGARVLLPKQRLLIARTTRDPARSIMNWKWSTIGIDGSNEMPIKFPVPAGQAVYISVSPSNDGTRLAFLALRTDDSHKSVLYVVNLDGSGLRQLAELQQDAGGIAWSRDDRTLALVDSYTPHPMPAGFVMDAVVVTVDVASGAMHTLTPHNHRFIEEHPSWGPDGSIYFQSQRDGPADIFRMNADGSNQRRVTSKSP